MQWASLSLDMVQINPLLMNEPGIDNDNDGIACHRLLIKTSILLRGL